MKRVNFTQYLRPHGRPRAAYIFRPVPIADKAVALGEAGYRLEAEVLTTGQVSLTVSDGDQDIAHELAPNGPEVPQTVDALINSAYHRLGKDTI